MPRYLRDMFLVKTGNLKLDDFLKRSRCGIIRGLKMQIIYYREEGNPSPKVRPWFYCDIEGNINFIIKYFDTPLQIAGYDETEGKVFYEEMFVVQPDSNFIETTNHYIELIKSGKLDYAILIAQYKQQQKEMNDEFG